MGLTITADHIAAAKSAGACADVLSRLKPGMPVSSLAWEHLTWAEERLPELAAAAARQAKAPLWSLSGSGSGYGYGYGDGSGSGSGYGYGYGYGDGDGDGDGYGSKDIVR